MGVERSIEPASVGVFFGREGGREPGVDVEDPFFGGTGPRRRGCIECGRRMTSCRHDAKNTLVKNYLYLAELAGVAVHPERTVTAVRPLPGDGYRVDTRRTGAWRRRGDDRPFIVEHVVISAGTWGTQQLPRRMKADGVLHHLSDRLGLLSRTDPESIGSVRRNGVTANGTTSRRVSR
jgi:cholesterol oxidase